ncbi:MAG: hypothetical protein JGK01_15260 [Microcoleus sp. PH2017_03_ELD_O_A]|nr:hypothetical protein [Microcoleus sp. PH2017_03_ELD_O_A]
MTVTLPQNRVCVRSSVFSIVSTVSTMLLISLTVSVKIYVVESISKRKCDRALA